MTVITEPSVKTELPRTCSIIQRATVTPADLSALVSLSLIHIHSVIEILENRNFEKSDRFYFFFFSPDDNALRLAFRCHLARADRKWKREARIVDNSLWW